MPEERSLIPGDAGRLHFAPKFGALYDESPKKISRQPKASGHDEPRGKRPIPAPLPKPDRPEGKRAIPEMTNKRGTELPSNALTTNWNNKRVVTQNFDGTGPPMRQKQSQEFAMEVYMNRKQRYYGEKHNPMSDSDVKYSMSCTNQVDHSKPN